MNKFEPGVRAEGTRNPNFFKDGSGHFDSYEHLSILDVTARQEALMNGDVYVIDKVSAKTVNLLYSAPNINIKEDIFWSIVEKTDGCPFMTRQGDGGIFPTELVSPPP